MTSPNYSKQSRAAALITSALRRRSASGDGSRRSGTLPLIDHALIADAQATDLAAEYCFSNLTMLLTRTLQLSPAEAAAGAQLHAILDPLTRPRPASIEIDGKPVEIPDARHYGQRMHDGLEDVTTGSKTSAAGCCTG